MEMTCQLCKQRKNLVKSHIIPASLFKNAYPNRDGVMVSDDDYYSKRRPIGIYSQFLCQDCENSFAFLGDYGTNFFKSTVFNEQHPVKNNGLLIGYKIYDVDYIKLKLFLLSVLWRADVCMSSFFDQVSLGLFSDKLKEMILKSDAGNMDDFSIIIRRYRDNDNNILHPPERTKFRVGSCPINIYKLYLFNAEIIIKVDKRALPQFRELILSPSK